MFDAVYEGFLSNWKRFLATLLILAMCTALLPGALLVQRADALPGATFDLFSMWPDQMLSPSTGKTFTFMSVDTSNITDDNRMVVLSASSESSYFSTMVIPPLVKPVGPEGSKRAFVLVFCSPDTPDGTVGNIKITGNRAGEKHRVWLKATAKPSEPYLELTSGDMLLGQGYKDQVLQPFVREPVSWTIGATNQGGANDTYALGYSADFPCDVRFLNSGGNEITEISVKALTHNYLYPGTVHFGVEVTPTVELPKNEVQDITIILGPGDLTSETSEVTVQLFNPGLLFQMNAVDSLRQYKHQVMPGETTSYIVHVSNPGDLTADVTLQLKGDTGDWDVSLDTDFIDDLAPGDTTQALVTATASETAVTGDKLNFRVKAISSLGTVEKVKLKAEITDVPNIYYWAIDSMDPEYLYVNSNGTDWGSEGDWLMPNLRAFLDDSVNYTDAKVYLPAATDMNHTNALAGTYTGTSGVYMVSGTYRGFTEHDDVIDAPNDMDLMLYGPSGEPIDRVYEVSKDILGANKSLCGFWSNKNWLADVEGGEGTVAEGGVDIIGHSERFPLFFPPPYKYIAGDPVQGDPPMDFNPGDPNAGPFTMCFYDDITREILIPTLLGQFNFLLGLGIFILPVNIVFGIIPGSHCEDRYLADMFFRTILEEDPDVSYINVADLDNTGHFTGSSWNFDEFDTKGTPEAHDDVSMFSPWMRRDECIDIAREADDLFADFIDLLKARGVYDNSIVIVLSDHGMENVKDIGSGYEVLDLREILRDEGYVHKEDYFEGGGTQINFVWCDDPARCQDIETVLEDFTIDDPDLGPVQPLTVIDRDDMINGVDYGVHGRVRPMELFSEYWDTHTTEPNGHLWPDLFVFPLYNYNIAAHGQILAGTINPVGISLGNLPDHLRIGFPGAHGGLSTTRIPLMFKAPAGTAGFTPGSHYDSEVEVGDIAPTIYQILGWPEPDCVDGSPLPDGVLP